MAKRRVPVRAEAAAPPPEPPEKAWLDKFSGERRPGARTRPEAPAPAPEPVPVSEEKPSEPAVVRREAVAAKRTPSARSGAKGETRKALERLFVKKDLAEIIDE